MLFETLLSCLLVALTAFWVYRKRKCSEKNYPKGPWGIPVFGHLPFLGASPIETFQNWSEKYGNVFMIRLGNWNTVVVNGEKAIREIARRKDAFSDRPPFGIKRLMKDLYGGHESLSLTNVDDTYIQHRKLTIAALRICANERENAFEDLIIEESIKMMEDVLKVEQDSNNLYNMLPLLIANILFQLLYGRGKDASKSQQVKTMVDANDAFIEVLKTGNVVDVLPWLKLVMPSAVEKMKKHMNIHHAIWKANVDEHIETFDGANIRDLTDIFLTTKLEDAENVAGNDKNKSDSVSRKRLLYTLYEVFSIGMDGTVSTLRWLFLYMIEYPEVQQRVFKEIHETVGQNRQITWADHFKLPYTESSLKEVMRISPVGPFGLPHYTNEDTKLDNLDIDKDTVVMINFHSVSQDQIFWGDPQNFRPERYLLDNGELDPVKMKYEVTFGVGRRTCAGEDLAKKKLFLIFTTLIQRYVFSKQNGDVLDFTPVVGLTYLPKPYRILTQERV